MEFDGIEVSVGSGYFVKANRFDIGHFLYMVFFDSQLLLLSVRMNSG